MDGSTLGHLVLLSVQVKDDTGRGRDMKCVSIYVWTPNKILEKDKTLPFAIHGGSYYDCINDMSWDDWTGPFQSFIEEGWCETGVYEPEETYHNVRFDDKRIQVAFVDPMNRDYSARCSEIKPTNQ